MLTHSVNCFFAENTLIFIHNGNVFGIYCHVMPLSEFDRFFRPDVMKQLAVAERIRTTFFTPQNGLGAQFAIEPVSLTGNKRRALLNLDGQLVDYSHGRRNVARLIWPNSMRAGTESQLTLMPANSNRAPRAVSFSGPWAQLRLINSGTLTDIQPGFFDVRFSVDGGDMTYRVYVDESDNPFAGGLFSQFTLPDTLY